ncbi:pilus assembly protein CpaF [Skermanella aerolata]|uniref:Pilus assembly protein CpaF n=1 Tax=Skermanella aerolata TaxID=393310 RepID=A0A512DVR8_9PROT|nr:CpaF family protein [Skermanella aerolata]GEO40564.1 pilus assembly protein CpaF [Skermanella aerolata]
MSGLFGRKSGAALTEAAPAPQLQPQPQPALVEAAVTHDQSSPRARSLDGIRTEAMSRIDPAAVARLEPAALRPLLENLIDEIATENRFQLNSREQSQLANELVHDMLGFGPLEPLLEDDRITDIMVNGPHRVFVEQQGKLVLSGVRFRDQAHVLNIAQRIAGGIGRRIDESSPMVDARLPDGSRVNIVVPPLALDGTCISIRKFARRRIDLASLVSYRSLSEPMARALEIFSRARLNVIISGGTGSGKTTLLNAMSRMIDIGERVVTIEDAAELQLQQPHVVRLETRPANLEGQGQITQRDLVRNALRMRPDRIIIGEVRGSEAFDMLQAMNTGHDGSMSTVHANNTRDALARIENMVMMGSVSLPPRAVRHQIASAVHIIVQVQRMRDGVRRITQISELAGLEGDVMVTQDLFTFEFQGEHRDGTIRGTYRSAGVRPSFMDRLEYFGLDGAYMAAVEQDRG